ncbi:MAG: hypothetical protein JKY37_01480 [Nannocystaceae bacterium]|nr:hypothetical protein [Nannocystaceae bacterium]
MTTTSLSASLSVGLGLVLAIACRADVGERCICADDCKSGLVCVSGGRELRTNECIPASSDNDPGECVEDAAAGEGEEDGNGGAVLYMDLGSKRDFDPSVPVPETSSSGGTETGEASSSTGSSSGTGTGSGTGSSSGSSSSSSTGSSSGTTASSSSGSGTSTTSGSSSGDN